LVKVGTTLSDPKDEAWDILLARREHWNLTVRGIGRTGFVNGGYCGNQSFPLRVRQVVADNPQMVIVEGGLNDAGQSGIGAAARAVLAKIPATIRVVVIGPTDAPGRSGADKKTIDRELAAAAGTRYVSPLRWQLQFGSGESAGGVAPPAALRTGRDDLSSSGPHSPAGGSCDQVPVSEEYGLSPTDTV
jgi:hypothetical protein